ncbi:MAG: IS66 family transposase [Gammaproteobacteria bacterium]|nr:MAG: IS66 family transposase [Gammaproteobacteria bacterium]
MGLISPPWGVIKNFIMTVFFNGFLFNQVTFFAIIPPIKLPPQTNKNEPTPSIDTVLSMQDLLSKKDGVIKEKSDIIAKKSDVISEQKQRIEILEEYLRLSKVKRFGASSEQTPPEQGNLFNEAEVTAAPEPEPDPLDLSSTDDDKNKKTGRKPFDKKIPRHQVFAYLSDEDKAGAINTFFVKVREELDIVPAKVQILEYMQEKAVFKDEQGNSTIKLADMVKNPIAKAMGSVNLMTYVVVAKYVDGLPLHRLEKIIQRYGGSISRATLANWVIGLANQVQCLVNLLREYQHTGAIIMADETRIQVLKEPDKPASSDKWMWVTLGGPPDKQSVLFDYDPSRAQAIPMRLLEGFKDGYLQADGYAGYNKVCKENNLIRVGCWDHARRKFVEAQKALPKGKKIKASKADMALSFINKLYKIEREIKASTGAKKLAVRQEKSVPVLNKLKKWLEINQPRTAKDGLTGIAMTYLHNQWERLNVYCTDGRLSISNILAENAIRPFAIGRRAWLFADTPAGANASAIHYGLIETALCRMRHKAVYTERKTMPNTCCPIL